MLTGWSNLPEQLPISVWDTMGWAENVYAMGGLNLLLDGHLDDRFPLKSTGVRRMWWTEVGWLFSGCRRVLNRADYFLSLTVTNLRKHTGVHTAPDPG
jgi:hypothetical protein